MLHQLRIPAIVLTIGILSLMIPAVSAGNDAEPGNNFQERRTALAEQLSTLLVPAPVVDMTAEDAVKQRSLAPEEVQRRKTALLSATLDSLITGQSAPKPEVASNKSFTFAVAKQHDLLLPQVSGLTLMAIEEEDAGAFPEDGFDDIPVEVESTDIAHEDVDMPAVEEAPPPPPLPPAPRVQTTQDVQDANVSLIRALQQPQEADAPVTLDAVSAADEEVAMPAIQRRPRRHAGRNAMDQIVNIDFRDTDLTHVVAVLALKADINIIAGADLRGTVTANLHQVPLRVAMETVLRMNGLGMVEEEGIYFIVPYEEAASVNRTTTMVALENAKSEEVLRVLQDLVSGVRDEALISISANRTANVLVISGPKNRTEELVAMAHQLDVTKPVLPTITEAISLNYSEPGDMVPLVQNLLTERIGQVAGDERARHLVVTDLPVVIEQVKELVMKLDKPTKQVLIETMVVDAILSDEADTGVQWLIQSLHRQSRSQAMLGDAGRSVGNLQDLSLGANMPILQDPGSLLTFSVLTDKIDWTGLIQMEIRNRNGRLVSNPVLLTLENSAAEISISQEIPYTELTQTAAGGQQTSTRFKEVGTVLSVTPRVTHDNTIITTIDGKESTTTGSFQGVPIEDKREISSTMRMANGQTIFIGGLRKSDGSSSVRKIPVLGDIPVVNFLFRSTQRQEQINELLVFLTCTVIEDEYRALTPRQQEILDTTPPIVPYVDAWGTVMHDTLHPHDMKEHQFRWRRGT